MTRTASRAAHQAASAAAAPAAAPPAHTTVAATGGAQTTSREPPAADAEPAAANGSAAVVREPAGPRKPAAQFAAVGLATRIPELAKWIAARPSFTFADAAAASAPSPCSQTVMAYTLPDPRLASALTELGYVVTAGGKNGYTVTVIKTPAGGLMSSDSRPLPHVTGAGTSGR